MKPTVGRIVHYFPAAWDADEINHNGAQVLPAVITQVWSDTCVNLKVLTDGPRNAWKTSVINGTVQGCWNWPPRE